MNDQGKSSPLIAKILLLLFVLMTVGIFLMKPPLSSSSTAQTERVFENAIPENAPFRIKIKKEKEKSFKDLKDEKWVREFELELTNTSDKPIYFIYIELITDVKIGNEPLVFSLVYGRAELGDIITKAAPEDESIKPGETYVFKIHPGQVPAWEKSLDEKSHPDATRIKAMIQMLSFGDGTGYFINKPYTRADKKQSSLINKVQPSNKGGPKISKWPENEPHAKTLSIIDTPVTLLPAYFLDRESFSQAVDQQMRVVGFLITALALSPMPLLSATTVRRKIDLDWIQRVIALR